MASRTHGMSREPPRFALAIARSLKRAGDAILGRVFVALFHALRLEGKPALIFSSHLANWELTALVAARYQLDAHLLYRRPNLRAVDDAVRAVRADTMGTLVATGLDAPVRLLRVIEACGHV